MSNNTLIMDLSSVQPQKEIIVNGGGEYAAHMLNYIIRYMPQYQIIALFDDRRGTNNAINNVLMEHQIKSYSFSNNEELGKIITFLSANVVYFPVCFANYSDVEISHEKKIIATIHDLSDVYADECKSTEEKNMFLDRNKLKRFVKRYILGKYLKNKHISEFKSIVRLSRNEWIITDSEYSKMRIKEACSPQRDPNVFYPLLFNADVQEDDNIINSLKLNLYGYDLLVSCSRWHKNNLFAVKCLDHAISRGILSKDRKFVLLGLDDEHLDYYRNKLINKENFCLLGYVSRPSYNSFLKNARFLIYPSLFEGFGAPPVEAMQFGTPSICSSSTCIPEICGNAAIYFDPYDENNFLECYLKSLSNGVREKLSDESRAKFKYIFKKQNDDLNSFASLIEKVFNS